MITFDPTIGLSTITGANLDLIEEMSHYSIDSDPSPEDWCEFAVSDGYDAPLDCTKKSITDLSIQELPSVQSAMPLTKKIACQNTRKTASLHSKSALRDLALEKTSVISSNHPISSGENGSICRDILQSEKRALGQGSVMTSLYTASSSLCTAEEIVEPPPPYFFLNRIRQEERRRREGRAKRKRLFICLLACIIMFLLAVLAAWCHSRLSFPKKHENLDQKKIDGQCAVDKKAPTDNLEQPKTTGKPCETNGGHGYGGGGGDREVEKYATGHKSYNSGRYTPGTEHKSDPNKRQNHNGKGCKIDTSKYESNIDPCNNKHDVQNNDKPCSRESSDHGQAELPQRKDSTVSSMLSKDLRQNNNDEEEEAKEVKESDAPPNNIDNDYNDSLALNVEHVSDDKPSLKELVDCAKIHSGWNLAPLAPWLESPAFRGLDSRTGGSSPESMLDWSQFKKCQWWEGYRVPDFIDLASSLFTDHFAISNPSTGNQPSMFCSAGDNAPVVTTALTNSYELRSRYPFHPLVEISNDAPIVATTSDHTLAQVHLNFDMERDTENGLVSLNAFLDLVGYNRKDTTTNAKGIFKDFFKKYGTLIAQSVKLGKSQLSILQLEQTEWESFSKDEIEILHDCWDLVGQVLYNPTFLQNENCVSTHGSRLNPMIAFAKEPTSSSHQLVLEQFQSRKCYKLHTWNGESDTSSRRRTVQTAIFNPSTWTKCSFHKFPTNDSNKDHKNMDVLQVEYVSILDAFDPEQISIPNLIFYYTALTNPDRLVSESLSLPEADAVTPFELAQMLNTCHAHFAGLKSAYRAYVIGNDLCVSSGGRWFLIDSVSTCLCPVGTVVSAENSCMSVDSINSNNVTPKSTHLPIIEGDIFGNNNAALRNCPKDDIWDQVVEECSWQWRSRDDWLKHVRFRIPRIQEILVRYLIEDDGIVGIEGIYSQLGFPELADEDNGRVVHFPNTVGSPSSLPAFALTYLGEPIKTLADFRLQARQESYAEKLKECYRDSNYACYQYSFQNKVPTFHPIQEPSKESGVALDSGISIERGVNPNAPEIPYIRINCKAPNTGINEILAIDFDNQATRFSPQVIEHIPTEHLDFPYEDKLFAKFRADNSMQKIGLDFVASCYKIWLNQSIVWENMLPTSSIPLSLLDAFGKTVVYTPIQSA